MLVFQLVAGGRCDRAAGMPVGDRLPYPHTIAHGGPFAVNQVESSVVNA